MIPDSDSVLVSGVLKRPIRFHGFSIGFELNFVFINGFRIGFYSLSGSDSVVVLVSVPPRSVCGRRCKMGKSIAHACIACLLELFWVDLSPGGFEIKNPASTMLPVVVYVVCKKTRMGPQSYSIC